MQTAHDLPLNEAFTIASIWFALPCIYLICEQIHVQDVNTNDLMTARYWEGNISEPIWNVSSPKSCIPSESITIGTYSLALGQAKDSVPSQRRIACGWIPVSFNSFKIMLWIPQCAHLRFTYSLQKSCPGYCRLPFLSLANAIQRSSWCTGIWSYALKKTLTSEAFCLVHPYRRLASSAGNRPWCIQVRSCQIGQFQGVPSKQYAAISALVWVWPGIKNH